MAKQAIVEEKCSICMERRLSTSTDTCVHLFCYRCINHWAKVLTVLWKKKNTCPVCRKVFRKLMHKDKVKEVEPPRMRKVARPHGRTMETIERRIVFVPYMFFPIPLTNNFSFMNYQPSYSPNFGHP